MIVRATREQEAQYKESPALNQSLLKILERGPELFQQKAVSKEEEDELVEDLEEYKRDKRCHLLGSGAERLLTYGEEYFNECFYISQIEKAPSEAVCSILNHTLSLLLRANIPPEELLAEGFLESDYFRYRSHQAMDAYGYYADRAKPTWQKDTRFLGILKISNIEDYWRSLVECENRKVITQEEFKIMLQIATNWARHPLIGGLFEDSSSVHLYYQFPIYFKYLEEDCKALLDMVRIDHTAKTIQIFDLKTMYGFTRYFPSSVRRFRYDIQAAFYTEALKQRILGTPFEKYQILPFTFIVESTSHPGIPLMFPCPDDVLRIGENGFPDSHRVIFAEGFPHKERQVSIPIPGKPGFADLILQYKWYRENGFTAHKDVVEQKGIIPIKFTDLL